MSHVYISPPHTWTAEQFKQWAPICESCGNLCQRWRWMGKRGARPAQYRCATCDNKGAK